MDAVKGTAEDAQSSGNEVVKTSEKQRTYILVPVEDEQVVK
jgi:hypothetical protein